MNIASQKAPRPPEFEKQISGALEDSIVEFLHVWERQRHAITEANLRRVGDALYRIATTEPFERPTRRAAKVVKLVRPPAASRRPEAPLHASC